MAAMTKEQSLTHWRKMNRRINPLRSMQAIPYKATGSRYGACGIRIDGNSEFIDAVLSNLTDLLDGENAVTRLDLSRNNVDGSTFGKSFANAADGAQVCYIRLHRRGHEGAMLQAYTNPGAMAAAQRMIDVQA